MLNNKKEFTIYKSFHSIYNNNNEEPEGEEEEKRELLSSRKSRYPQMTFL